jgi:hypothetical protein
LVWFSVAVLASVVDQLWLSDKMMDPLYVAIWGIVAWRLARWIKKKLATSLGHSRMPFRLGRKHTEPYVDAGIVLIQELVTSLSLGGWKDLMPSYTPDEVDAIQQELDSFQRIADDVIGGVAKAHPHTATLTQRMCAAHALQELAYSQWFWEDELPSNWKECVSTYLKAWASQMDPGVLMQLADLLVRAGYRGEAKRAYQVVLLFPTYADTYFAKQQTPEVVDGIVNQAKKGLQEL